MEKNVVCVWIGSFSNKEDFYKNYLSIDYSDEDNPNSKFGTEAGLEWYDEDFMESWWFEKMELEMLDNQKDSLLDEQFFFSDLRKVLEGMNLEERNTITFMFGQSGENSSNEELFGLSQIKSERNKIELVFKKEYNKE